jgi:acyl-coenzyme A synthetase/AMP-(fatty) acid ligase/lysophospholipase L1-like esterase/acyl carrier protein
MPLTKKTDFNESFTLDVIGITPKNSIDYLMHVFSLYQQDKIVVPIKNKTDISEYGGLNFTQIIEPKSGGGWIKEKQLFLNNKSIAHISFTSGTEGKPKGIVLSHLNLFSTIERLNKVMAVNHSIKEYVGVPIFHSFGFGRVRACLSIGGQAYIPENGFNPTELLKLIKEDKVNAISAVPTLWRLLLSDPDFIGDQGKKIKWIEIGSQYMSREEKEQMKALFPNANIVQHYGLTEASRTTFLNITTASGTTLDSVGQPTEEVKVSINDNGIIRISGDHVAQHRITAQGLINLTDDDGWFSTTDNGEINDGFVYFQGRADDVINCGGIKISPDIVESDLLQIFGKENGIAVCKINDTMRGDGILVSCEVNFTLDLELLKNRALTILKAINVHPGESLHVQLVELLPRTATGKIKRRTLSEKYNEVLLTAPSIEHQSKKNSSGNTIIDICQEKLGISNILPSDSFISLGGDSLFFVVISMEIENHLGELPENWEALTFDQLDNFKLAHISTPTSPLPYNKKALYIMLFTIFFLFTGEMFLQIRNYVKTGRSPLDLLNDTSTVIFNDKYNVRTYRPFLDKKTTSEKGINLKTNSLGLRSPEISLEPEKNEYRIAIIGSSTVAGAYAKKNELTFSQLLSTKLSKQSTNKVNVINAGIPGLTVTQISKIAQNIIYPMRPSVIGIYTGFNDIAGLCKRYNQKPKKTKKLPILKLPNWIMSKDVLRKKTTFLREQKTQNTNFLDPEKINLTDYKNSLEVLVQDIIKQGITPILITNARRYNNVEDERKESLAEDSLYYYYCLNLSGILKVGDTYNEQIRMLSIQYDIPLVDLEKAMPGGDKYFVDDGHFTLKGEQLAADMIFDAIKNN